MRPRFIGIFLFELLITLTSASAAASLHLLLAYFEGNSPHYRLIRDVYFFSLPFPYFKSQSWRSFFALLIGALFSSVISIGLMKRLAYGELEKHKISLNENCARTFWDTRRIYIVTLLISLVPVQLILWYFDGLH